MADKTKKEASKAKAEKKPKATEPKEEKATVKLSKKQQDILDSVKKMTVLEIADLVKAMEDEFGVSAAAPVAMAAAPAADAAAEEEEEKTSFNVELTSAGDQKIGVIKVVREFTDLGLKEAKDLVEAGGVIKENVKKEEAEEMKKKIEDAGGTVELK